MGHFDVPPNYALQQVKRYAIITYKHGLYELPHDLLKGVRVMILGN